YGFPLGKHAHTLWLTIGAEFGLPGLALLVAFYGLTVVRVWPMARDRLPVPHPWLNDAARMVICALGGFVVSAMFVSLTGLETPYYVALIGIGALKLASTAAPESETEAMTEQLPAESVATVDGVALPAN